MRTCASLSTYVRPGLRGDEHARAISIDYVKAIACTELSPANKSKKTLTLG